jgi:ABC-type Fe3+-hydroxamate transport system substrate-binding protein
MAARRVVSLVPSMTETLVELGAGDELVCCTRYCVEPEQALRLVPRVGGTKNPDLEKIAVLRPDLVVVNGEENRPEHIGWLGERFEVLETTPKTVPEAAAAVRALGASVGREAAAEELARAIEAEAGRAEVAGRGRRPVRTFYAIWKTPWMSVNRDTYIHDVLVRAGGSNACAEREPRYPRLNEPELGGLGAELVLLPSEPFEFEERHREEVLRSGLFGKDVPVVLCDGRAFCWHGARSARGLAAAVELLAPYRK